MPWHGPEVPGEFPTLGYQVADWIEERCAIPDREFVGDPFLLTDEQLRFLLHFYRLDPTTGRFVYHRGAQLTRPQKWGKGPLAAAIICAEAQGPVLFDRWDPDHKDGVVGKPWPTPLIQVSASSEDQADNIYSALLPMIELGALHGEIEDTGLGRINLPGGGKIEPVTASGRSRLGQRLTFSAQDQTESWLESNKGRELADNQRRNLAGMGGRWLSTPNAWDPVEESVAQYTSEHEHDGVYHDDVEPPEHLSIRNKAECLRALKAVYGDSMTGTRDGKRGVIKPWIHPDSIMALIMALINRDPTQAERYFLNRKRAPESAAFSSELWDSRADPTYPNPDAFIVLGGDGARYDDAFAVIATDIETGYQWVIGIWERPANAPDDYEHPRHEIDGAVREAFERFNVWKMYIDPQYVDPLVDGWSSEHGGEDKVVRWYTNRPTNIAVAVRSFHEAIATGDLTHDGDEDFARHIKNAVRRKSRAKDDENRPMWEIGKDRPGSPRKMDAAMAAVLSWKARSDAIAKGAGPEPTHGIAVW